MSFGGIVGIILAIALHVGFIAFGGLLFAGLKPDHGTLQEVELIADELVDEKKPEDDPEEKEELETELEEAPDASEILESLEKPVTNEVAALDAASLSAIEAALSGQGASGEFTQMLDFQSGFLHGTKKGGGGADQFESAFSLDEIDQKPRAVFQAAPIYPGALRSKKLEGVVTVLFVVDAAGKVTNPRVEKSAHPAFEKPALDAVKKWKFEAAVKGGTRVACKMRVPIRFQPS